MKSWPEWWPEELIPAVPASAAGAWLEVLFAMAIAVAIALAIHFVGGIALGRAASGRPFASRMLRTLRIPTAALMVLVAVMFVFNATDALPYGRTAHHLTALALIGVATWLCVVTITSIGRAVEDRYPLDVADNLQARQIRTQSRLLVRTACILVVLIGIGLALATFPGIRQIGVSLLASAGVAGIVAGLAARPVLGNLIAGLQIAISQPIRIDDVLIVEGEWGRVEEITGAFVVVRVWDQRRLIVPLQWFIEHPFQNWTRRSSELIGVVFLWLDFSVPMAELRAALQRICEAAPEWDGRTSVMQVTDATERTMQVRALVSARNAGDAFGLRCKVREGLIAFVQEHYPHALPRLRHEFPGPDQPPSPAHGVPLGHQASGPASS